jgi:hypothetical protein
MSTVAIVLLALAAGAFLILLLGALGICIWATLHIARQQRDLKAIALAVQTETSGILSTHAGKMKAEVESAKASFVAIRNEIRAAWVEETRAINAVLGDHRKEMAAAIEKINADALQAAAVRSIQAVQKLEKAVGILQGMMLEAGERPGEEYGPEEYAPESDGKFGTPSSRYSVSAVARLDEEAATEERVESEAGAG